MSSNIDSLLHGYLDETLSPEQLAELETWISADLANARRFAETVYLDERLEAEIKLQQFSAEESETPVSRKPARPTRVIAICLALAACLLLIASLPYWYGDSNQASNDVPPQIEEVDNSFVTITLVENVRTESGQELHAGDRLAADQLHLREGVLHLEFDSGVEVTLEGPAQYQIETVERTHLLSGLLTATVPDGAEGFVVTTPQSEIIDLGTAFGVALNDDGSSIVTVFDGEVEVIGKSDEKRRLVEGESLELNSQGAVSKVAFSTKRFEKLWPAASGIARSTGAFRFAPPWPRRLDWIESDANIFVFPEGYPVVLDHPCSVNIDAPGRYRRALQLTGGEIPAGTRVRSFILQFNPEDQEDAAGPESDKRIQGSITFTKPILGLIVREEELRATDGVFSLRGGRVPQFKRGLELSGSPFGDGIVLSEDRRTVRLDVSVWGPLIDQIRVIVDASLTQGTHPSDP